ncbi:serine protease [Nonomuraea longispora]|uniref:Serine protease n=1 Tax=Nonomuraea longispora TaxID=1848320 RepID=A0A4R4NC77_9ACTN|nr:S8 family serine peptidase [Nonomuraea longispora]TDC06489.1 serine protease [Nonomuraea longispora]
MWPGRWVRRGAAVAAVLAMGVTPVPGARADAVPALLPAERPRDYDVTLITGDKVHITVGEDGRQRASVTPRDPARSGFRMVDHGGELSVVPADVAALVPEKLDPALFNVTSLAAQGYTDQQTGSIPLIVRQGAGAAPPTGLTAVTRLESIGATAVKLAKKDAATFAAGLAAGVDKIWLDRKITVRPVTSASTAGAAARAAADGAGAGTTVAVLDSGIDAGHPDLAGKVAGARDFTYDGDGVDRYGSGTAMAGVIAGSGASSGGTYTGVAPGARLLNGKVIDGSGGGLASWAIAGMEWASGEAGADVVTMAVSVPGQGGPLTDAVNELTARNGTLFVMSTGDRGCEACVDSPADAPAALTVGAVDANGEPAEFSGHGPVGLHRAVKPELSAPGVGVVSTSAANLQPAEPVGDHYGRFSGTALSASYAAGAAALLRQARPGITAPEIRSALVGGSEALPGVPVDEGGAGRLDVAGALARTVLAGDAVLDFGLTTAGAGEPVTRTVSYRNFGAEPATVALDAAAPFTLSATELTLPAGGKGQVDVTLDPARTPAGWARAELVATPAGGAALRTLLTGNVEERRVELRVSAVARDGRPSRVLPSVVDVDDGALFGRGLPSDPDRPCESDDGFCWLVPPGTYSILGIINTLRPGATRQGRGDVVDQSFTGYPEMKLTRDTHVVLDARKAVAVRIDTPGHRTARNRGAATKLVHTRLPVKGPRHTESFLLDGRLEENYYLQPTGTVSKGEFAVATRWRLEAPAITMRTPGVDLHPRYVDPVYFSNRSTQYPRLDGTAVLTVADAGDGALKGLDLRGRLALIRRTPGASVSALANAAGAAGARMVAIYGDTHVTGNESLLTVPTVTLAEPEGERLAERASRRRVQVVAKGVVASPYVYDLYLSEEGRVRKRPSYVAAQRSLARVDTAFHAQLTDDVTLSEVKYGWMPWENFSWDSSRTVARAPRVRTDYLSPAPGVRWHSAADMPERSYNAIFPEDKQGVMTVRDATRGYRAGERIERTWLRHPVAPGFAADSPTQRQGDVLTVDMRAFVDAEGNTGSRPTDPFPHGYVSDWRIYKGDELIGRTQTGGSGRIVLPPERAGYRVEYTVENRSSWARLSTRTRTVWTFDSEHAEGDPVRLPLLAVAYDAPVDLRNRTASTRLGLTVSHQAGAQGHPIRKVSLETSSDDGRTWRPARRLRDTGHGTYAATIERPAPGVVSLRVTASDAAGSTVTQEVIRAYGTR